MLYNAIMTKAKRKRPTKTLYNVRIPQPLLLQVRKHCRQNNLSQTRFAELAFNLWLTTKVKQ
jgi:predicted XRE-type DNA-binding protein